MRRVHRVPRSIIPFYANVFSYNEIYNCGYETTITGARIPGGAMMTDFGCFYISADLRMATEPTRPTRFKSPITRSMTSAPPPIQLSDAEASRNGASRRSMRYLIITMAIIRTASWRKITYSTTDRRRRSATAVYPTRITAAHRKFEIDHRRITSSPACFRRVRDRRRLRSQNGHHAELPYPGANQQLYLCSGSLQLHLLCHA